MILSWFIFWSLKSEFMHFIFGLMCCDLMSLKVFLLFLLKFSSYSMSSASRQTTDVDGSPWIPSAVLNPPKWTAVTSAHSRLSHAFRLNSRKPQIRGGLAVVGARKGYVPSWEWTEGFSSARWPLPQQQFQLIIKLLCQIQGQLIPMSPWRTSCIQPFPQRAPWLSPAPQTA